LRRDPKDITNCDILAETEILKASSRRFPRQRGQGSLSHQEEIMNYALPMY
jgi:hypothetical protein